MTCKGVIVTSYMGYVDIYVLRCTIPRTSYRNYPDHDHEVFVNFTRFMRERYTVHKDI